MITTNIINKIEALSPLPKTVIEIDEFRKKSNKEIPELLEIIQKDALVVSTLLKIANSAMFGFRSKIETPSHAINLLGINFTITIAIGGIVQNLLISNLEPYGISCDDFMESSNLSSKLVSLWLSNIDNDLKEELLLPALLQEVGKFILSEVIINEGKCKEFKTKVSMGIDLSSLEKEFTGFTSSEIIAKIFRHWNLSERLITLLEYLDDIPKCDIKIKHKVEILDVVKTACEVTEPLSEKNITLAIEKAKRYNLNVKELEESIKILKNRMMKMLDS